MSDAPSNRPDSDNETGAVAPGEWLREKRESLGWPLEQVGQELRILPSVLRALEENRFEVLEAPIFVRGHLRNYARLLGLSAETILEAYEASRPSETDPSLKVASTSGPAMDSRTPAWVVPFAWLILLTMLVLGGLYWYVGPTGDSLVTDSAETNSTPTDSLADGAGPEGREGPSARPLEEAVTRSSDNQAVADDLDLSGALAPLPGVDAAGEQEEEGSPQAGNGQETETVADIPIEPTVEQEDADAEAAGGDASTSSADEVDDAESAEAVDPGPVPEAGTPGVRSLTLRLSEDSWLEIYDDQDRQLYYGLAAAGEEVHLRGEAPISLFMGNAPAVELEVDGQPYDFSTRIRRDNTTRFTVREGGDEGDGEPSEG